MKNTSALSRLISGLMLLLTFTAKGQHHQPQKGQFFVFWGYNRAWFKPSDIHVHGPGYDLTFYRLKAKDRPSPVNIDYINPTKLSIPQFNFRLGYQVNDRFSLSLGTDHMKYVVVQDQVAEVSGYVSKEFSEKYEGLYNQSSKTITRDFLRYEHTNGFNYISLDAEYLQPILPFANNKGRISWNIGGGGFVVLPKSDIQVCGYGADNRFHVAGYAASLKTGPRFDFQHFFLSSEWKFGYATMADVLINNDAPDRSNHNVAFAEFYVVLGYKFRLWKSKSFTEEKAKN